MIVCFTYDFRINDNIIKGDAKLQKTNKNGGHFSRK